jgi:hypothetical protein
MTCYEEWSDSAFAATAAGGSLDYRQDHDGCGSGVRRPAACAPNMGVDAAARTLDEAPARLQPGETDRGQLTAGFLFSGSDRLGRHRRTACGRLWESRSDFKDLWARLRVHVSVSVHSLFMTPPLQKRTGEALSAVSHKLITAQEEE